MEKRRRGSRIYPCVVELGLDANHIALLLILSPEDPELIGVERTAYDKHIRIAARYICSS